MSELVEDIDPYSPHNAPGLSLIMQFRIYDVLMALLRERDEQASDRLIEVHARGAVLGTYPEFTGEFLTDVINPDEFLTDSTEAPPGHLSNDPEPLPHDSVSDKAL